MRKPLSCLTLSVLLLAMSPLSYADKPDKSNKGHGHSDHGNGGGHSGSGGNVNISIGAYFGGTQRQAVHDYYGPEVHAGKCPPGLAKKNNGCMPPGQAKKWSRGQPLTVEYYPVPSALVTRLGPPPAGYKYVRVASDILLITVGTSMVVDAIEDLGGL